MSRTSSSRPASSRSRKSYSVIPAVVVLVLLGIGVIAYSCANVDNAMQGSTTFSTPPVAGTATSSSLSPQYCHQAVATPVVLDMSDVVLDVEPVYVAAGYCYLVNAQAPWKLSKITQLPDNSIVAVVYNQTPDVTTVNNRMVVVFSTGDAFSVDTVRGSYADGTAFAATPVAMVVYARASNDADPRALPLEVPDALRQAQLSFSLAAVSATSPVFGIPSYPDLQSALQVPGWK